MGESKVVCTPEQFRAMTPSARREAVREQIDLTPEHWEQGAWMCWDDEYVEQEDVLDELNNEHGFVKCGTAFCFAGWACFLAGDKFLNDDEVRLGNGQLRRISRRAQTLLNLSDDRADELFSPSNDLSDIDRILAGGHVW